MCNALCDMSQEAIGSSHLYEEESSVFQDESNHYDVEQELLEQERFRRTEITFTPGQAGRQEGGLVGR